MYRVLAAAFLLCVAIVGAHAQTPEKRPAEIQTSGQRPAEIQTPGQRPAEINVEACNLTTPELCAEKDNVQIDLASPLARSRRGASPRRSASAPPRPAG